MSKEQIERIVRQDFNVFDESMSQQLMSIEQINDKINEKAKFLVQFQNMLQLELGNNGLSIDQLIEITYPIRAITQQHLQHPFDQEHHAQHNNLQSFTNKTQNKEYFSIDCQTDPQQYSIQLMHSFQQQNLQYQQMIINLKQYFRSKMIDLKARVEQYKSYVSQSMQGIHNQLMMLRHQFTEDIDERVTTYCRQVVSSMHQKHEFEMEEKSKRLRQVQQQRQQLVYENLSLSKLIKKSKSALIITPFIVDISSQMFLKGKNTLSIQSQIHSYKTSRPYLQKKLTITSKIITHINKLYSPKLFTIQSNINMQAYTPKPSLPKTLAISSNINIHTNYTPKPPLTITFKVVNIEYIPLLQDLQFEENSDNINSFNHTYRNDELKEITFKEMNIPQQTNQIKKMLERTDRFQLCEFGVENNINSYNSVPQRPKLYLSSYQIPTQHSILQKSYLKINKENNSAANLNRYELPLVKHLNVGVPPVQNGFGILKIGNKNIYKGTWRNGKFQGTGKLKWQDYIYDGDFVNGLFHGHGNFQSKEIKYIGKFMCQKAVGEGTLLLNNQKIFGFWNQNKLLKKY